MENVFNDVKRIILKYDNIILLGHKDPDLDSLGSCLGLYEIVKQMSKNAFVFFSNFIEEYNSNIINSFNLLNDKRNTDCFINKTGLEKLKNRTLLIITDVNNKDRLEYPEIVDKYDYIVLDHHIKNKNYLRNSKYTFNDSSLSSMCELVTFLAQHEKVNLTETTATILLAGIEIDTNGFNLKTTNFTYEAASILMKMGADSILKQELLKETKEEYIKRANFIRNSFMVNDYTALCIIPSKISSVDMSMISEELLTFENVEASFTIGKIDRDIVGISARSLGDIDVLNIIKQLGGGGHKSNAATQIKDKSINQIKNELINLIISN